LIGTAPFAGGEGCIGGSWMEWANPDGIRVATNQEELERFPFPAELKSL
jgi:hypothetical protein